MEPLWAYIWELDCPITGKRIRTDSHRTLDEVEEIYGSSMLDLNAVIAERPGLDRNTVPANPIPQPKSKALPKFDRPTSGELRALWRQYPEGHLVRRLIAEIVLGRKCVKEAEDLRQIVEKCWKMDVGGELVALYRMRLLLHDEMRAADI